MHIICCASYQQLTAACQAAEATAKEAAELKNKLEALTAQRGQLEQRLGTTEQASALAKALRDLSARVVHANEELELLNGKLKA